MTITSPYSDADRQAAHHSHTAQADVVIVGAGIAGLTLARHLLLDTERSVLLIDRLAHVPPPRQKVGESSVQVSGYYFSRVLDLEEHLMNEHYLKYNLRFYWKTAGLENRRFEDYSQSYIRQISNICSYQLDRNRMEAELLRLNQEQQRFRFAGGARKLKIELAESGTSTPHRVSYQQEGATHTVDAGWVVDTTGRNRLLAGRMDLKRPSPIQHGTYYAWVDGLIDIEKLTDRTRREVRLNPDRSQTGHLPFWLATNHFMGEGFWLWVIPLRGKTSLGVVYDQALFPHRFQNPEDFIRWICEEFPMFADDLPRREILARGGFRQFSHDIRQVMSAQRWAFSGEAGRFNDPLYSPGGDLIAMHNTLIVDAIRHDREPDFETRIRQGEQLLRAAYEAYLPGYTASYDVLGDPEVFSLKYTWELSIYFALYVFPFINDLFTERSFVVGYLRQFSRLGAVNRGLQNYMSAFYRWKMEHEGPATQRTLFDFTDLEPLRLAAETFYEVGLSPQEGKKIVQQQLEHLMELARFTAVHLAAAVVGDDKARTHAAFVESFDLQNLSFDADEIRRRWEILNVDAVDAAPYRWGLDPSAAECFRGSGAGETIPAATDAAASENPAGELGRTSRRRAVQEVA